MNLYDNSKITKRLHLPIVTNVMHFEDEFKSKFIKFINSCTF